MEQRRGGLRADDMPVAHGCQACSASIHKYSGESVGPANNGYEGQDSGMVSYDGRGICLACHQRHKYSGAPRINQ